MMYRTRSINQSMDRQRIDQSINRSINQSINRSTRSQLINQSIEASATYVLSNSIEVTGVSSLAEAKWLEHREISLKNPAAAGSAIPFATTEEHQQTLTFARQKRTSTSHKRRTYETKSFAVHAHGARNLRLIHSGTQNRMKNDISPSRE